MSARIADPVDVIDRINLTAEAVDAWMRVVRAPETAARLRGIDPAQLGDERARVDSDGSLVIFVPLPGGGEISLPVPAGHWSWADRFRQN